MFKSYAALMVFWLEFLIQRYTVICIKHGDMFILCVFIWESLVQIILCLECNTDTTLRWHEAVTGFTDCEREFLIRIFRVAEQSDNHPRRDVGMSADYATKSYAPSYAWKLD